MSDWLTHVFERQRTYDLVADHPTEQSGTISSTGARPARDQGAIHPSAPAANQSKGSAMRRKLFHGGTTTRFTCPRPARQAFLLALLAVAIGALAACGGSTESPSAEPAAPETGSASQSSESGGSSELNALLPESIRSEGKIVVAVTPTYPPYEYLDSDGETVIGQNGDVMTALGELLGVDIEYSHVQEFAAILTGIDAGRYDAGIIFADTPEREQVVDIVSFYNDGIAFLGPKDVAPDDTAACGKVVDVGRGSTATLAAPRLNKSLCTDRGLPEMILKHSANTDQSFVALQSGRLDFILTSPGVAAEFAKQANGDFHVTSQVFEPTPIGVAVSKAEPELSEALAKGLQQLIDDGTMEEIFTKWGTTVSLGDTAGINVVGSTS